MAKIKKAMKGGSKVAGKAGKGGKRMESDQERQVSRREAGSSGEAIHLAPVFTDRTRVRVFAASF